MDVTATQLFDSAFLAKLEQLHLLARKLFRGDRKAERRSRRVGSSLEFADHREYSAGDELRSIDWNAYARLERLFVKLYEHEQDLSVSFLVDASASMRWKHSNAPQGSISKLDQALRLTAALSYIALANLDAVNIHFFASSLLNELGVARGKSQFHTVLDFLRNAPAPVEPTRLTQAARNFTQRVKRHGLVFLLSDFFDPSGFEEPLSLLRHAGFELHALQILDPAELSPTESGDLRLIEPESSAVLEVTANESLLRRYRAELDRFLQNLEQFCLRRGITCTRILSNAPFEDIVLKVLRDGVMLR